MVKRQNRIRTVPAMVAVGGIGYVVSLLGMAWLSQASGCATEAAAGCQAWLWANPFWASFYSNLMSTFVGAGLGLWTALYLNRVADENRKSAEESVERERTLARLSMLQASIERLRQDMVTELNNAMAKDGTRGVSTRRFDVTTWSALSRDILVSLPNHGSKGIQLAGLLEEFFGLTLVLQGHKDRIVELMHSGARGTEPRQAIDGNYGDALFQIFITDGGLQVQRAVSVQRALEEFERTVSQKFR